MATISTHFTDYALKRAQKRGIARETLALVLERHDHSKKTAGRCRALWIGRRGREALIRSGMPPALVERAAGIRLIVSMVEDAVITVEHALARRHWC